MNADEILALFPPLAALSREGRDAILREGRVAVVPAGTVLQPKSGVCAGLPLVATGEIQVRATRESSRSLLLYSVTRGQTCVLTAGCILSGNKPFAAEAVTTEKTTALVIPAETLPALFASEPALRELVFSTVAGRLGDLLEVVEDVAFERLDRRIADWLVSADAVDPAAWTPAIGTAIASAIGVTMSPEPIATCSRTCRSSSSTASR